VKYELVIELTIHGGFGAFPGISMPIKLDSASLSPSLATELRRRFEAAETEARHRQSGKSDGVPDGRRYRMVIQSGGQRYQIDAADPVVPPAAAALMEFVRANGHR
jgi:Emfourin